MANLPESSKWEEGIYQLEVTDPVMGGPEGVDNKPIKQLANRTKYLKEKVEKAKKSADSKVSKSGDTITGDLKIQKGNGYSRIYLGASAEDDLILSSVPPGRDDMGAFIGKDNTLQIPNKSGVLLSSKDISNETDSDSEDSVASSKALKDALAKAVPVTGGTITGNLKIKREDGFSRLYLGASDEDDLILSSVPPGRDNMGAFIGKDNTLQIPNKSGVLATKEDIDAELKRTQIGVPVPYPSSTPPAGYLVMKGQTFSAATYPELAKIYGNRLPDLRGQFIRGWDNSRGIDQGRHLLSNQGDAIRDIVGGFSVYGMENRGTGAIRSSGYIGRMSGGNEARYSFDFKASRVVPTANENRPRNIAFNYICLAG